MQLLSTILFRIDQVGIWGQWWASTGDEECKEEIKMDKYDSQTFTLKTL